MVIRLAKKSIEHILPQTPEDESYWTKQFTSEQRNRYTNDIGNLVLTEDNSSYGRKEFLNKLGEPGAKYPCYANSNLCSERDLYNYRKSGWVPESIEQHREEIIDWALKRWYIEEVSTDGSHDEKAQTIDEDEQIEEIINT